MRVLFAGLLATLLSACASAPTKAPGPDARASDATAGVGDGPDAPIPSVVEELYDGLEAAVASYRDGLALVEQGSLTAADEVIDAALAELEDVADRCALVTGCDSSRVLGAYRTVLSLQASVFATGEPGDAELPNDEPPPPRVLGGRTLNGVDLAELIQLNRYVKDALHDWLTWNRPLLIKTWENYQFLREVMWPAWEAADLPEALLFGILAVESQGRVHSYSRAGAAGPLQFMRATARRYGLADTDGFDQRLDPGRAAEASVAYLIDQFQRLGSSLEKTLAAYNAGENRLARLDRRLAGADFWSSDFYYALPSDTRRYVPQVLAAAWLYLHATDYDLHWPRYDGAVAELALDREISLSELSICLGNDEIANGWFRALRNLNAHLDPGERLPEGARIRVPRPVAALYPTRCTDPDRLALAADLRDASESREADLLPYLVQRGDTLGLIASRYRCMSLKEIAALNDIRPPAYLIRAGKTLRVPNC